MFAIVYIEYSAGPSRLGRRIVRQAEPHDLATAVALEGVEALWATDPQFAERARVPNELPEGKSDGD